MPTEWPDQYVDLLKAWHAEGLSFGKMVWKFSAVGYAISRNAVIGKAHRIGLVGRKGSSSQPIEWHKSIVRSAPPRRKPVPAALLNDPPPPPLCIPMLELVRTHCHYPLWDDASENRLNFEHCGLPIDGEGPYCAHHARICFTTQMSKKYDISDAAKELAEIARNERALKAVA